MISEKGSGAKTGHLKEDKRMRQEQCEVRKSKLQEEAEMKLLATGLTDYNLEIESRNQVIV